MLAIFAALNDEIRLIKAEMDIEKVIHIRPFSIFIGKYQGEKIALARTGVGKFATEAAVSYCVSDLRPSLLMDIGYAGGLDPHLNAGDIAVARGVIEESSENIWTADKALADEAINILERAGIRNHAGDLVTVDRPLTDPNEKAFVGTRFEAIACDMESSALASVAQKAALPFLVIRSILDPLDVTLPEMPEEAVAEGNVKIWAFLNYLKKNPKDIFKLPKFNHLANQARTSLTNFVKAWVTQRAAHGPIS